MMTKHFKEIIKVSKWDNEVLQNILNIEEGHSEDYGSDQVIQTFSSTFETPYGGYGVDIKVCNGDTPYIDPVLFEIINHDGLNNWYEIYPLDVEDTLLGSYEFEHEVDGVEFTLEVILELED